MTTVHAPRQLPLALAYAPQYGRDTFVPGASNHAALRLIESWPDWHSSVVLVSGPRGSGKTHLAHIWAKRADAPILEAAGLSISMLPGLEDGGAMVIEDVDAATFPETALFHLINRTKEVRASLLVTSREAAGSWGVSLPDLRSRLRMAAAVALGAPDDELLRKVMVKLFADRQLIVDKQVVNYLLVRMHRSLGFAATVVRALDVAALAAGRRITRAVAAEVLADLDADRERFGDRQ